LVRFFGFGFIDFVAVRGFVNQYFDLV